MPQTRDALAKLLVELGASWGALSGPYTLEWLQSPELRRRVQVVGTIYGG